MATFSLKIVSPYGIHFEGEAEVLTVNTVSGYISVLKNHVNFVTSLVIGKAFVTINGEKKAASCGGGVLSVIKNEVTVLANSFEWQDEIDEERAKADLEKARIELKEAVTKKDQEIGKMRINRAITRIEVKNYK